MRSGVKSALTATSTPTGTGNGAGAGTFMDCTDAEAAAVGLITKLAEHSIIEQGSVV